MKLVEKNTDIFALIKSSETMYQNDRTKMEGKTKELEENYKQLYNQQQNVNKVLLEFESYIEKDVSTKKEANRNYIIYVLLFFILIVILLILIKTVII
jgi:t-SNARE complex subunit (syntaxin)